jgi:hypothetical protein
MHIIRNDRHIRVRSSIGKYMVPAGLLTLLAGLIISFVKQEWIVLTAVSLALGFALSLVGGFFTDRYVGPLAHHDALAKALKGLSDRYVLLQYVLPASHVLLEPGGCTVLVVKTQGGQVTCQEEGRWKHSQRGKLFRQFAGQEAVGIPDSEAERQARKLERWLAGRLPDVEVPVQAGVVFVNPDLALDAAASSVPTFYGKKVKGWLRGSGKLKPLSAAVYRQLADTLGVTPQQEEE